MPTLRPLTHPPRHHFFGYYGIDSWDSSCRCHLALETGFHEHPPRPDDVAAVGLIHGDDLTFEPIAQTSAFNLQQGSMMHWIETVHGEEFTLNDWEDGELVSRAISADTRASRTISSAIAAVSPTRPQAIGLNFKRMAQCRSVVGYASGNVDELIEHPKDDGLFLIDLETGGSSLLVSIEDVTRRMDAPAGAAWFNHVLFNTDGSRILFFCRVKTQPRYMSSLWTVNPDGTGLRCEIELGKKVSHFAWFDERRILISTDVLGQMEFVEFTDGEGDFQPAGRGKLPEDGHACFSPDHQWLVCDTYPLGPESLCELMLYNLARNEKITLGHFHSPEPFRGDIRCDLHPRWRRDGLAVSFDSVHEGTRQIYEFNVSDVVADTGLSSE
ncbi:MAG: hypothetical protein QGF00_18150 [Planctomycetota bacterium]|jgi:hypothetical protein|nr:hypothetical protein [Planctomycetota bacterium]MDP7251535.1 hypothetical protein [Planctomycetota bacterium]